MTLGPEMAQDRGHRKPEPKGRIEFTPIVLYGVHEHPMSIHPVLGAALAPNTGTTITIALPRMPECAHRPSLTTFIFDESGSVTAHNDPSRPISNRHREARLALERIGTCRCGNELAAVRFFDGGIHDVGPCPLTRTGRTILRTAIDNPPQFTSSELGGALDAAEALAANHPNHQHSLVVLSDFLLYDDDPEAVLDRFAAFPGDRHAVVLHTVPPKQLTHNPAIAVTRIEWDSEPGAVARALLPALTVTR